MPRLAAALLAAGAIFCAPTIADDLEPSTTGSAPADVLQTWIAGNALAVRSIDPMDQDFSDLEPLIQAIGPARVVQLGEPSHGAGSGFAAKVRLVKFLHQRMGFDVLAWESGLYEVRLAQAGIRAGEDPVAAAQRGILTIWSNAAEVKPLFEYVQASQAGTRPLEMAGFDMQITAASSDERFVADLRSFARALPDSALRHRVSMQVDRTITAYERITARNSARPGKADLRSLDKATDDLLAAIHGHRKAFEQAHGANEVAFVEHAIENMRGRGASVYYEREHPVRPTGPAGHALNSDQWNRRDTLMARNLRWLIQERHPGRKIVIWAHNAHLMNAHFAADWRSVHHEPQPAGMKPTGVFLAEWLEDGLYTIAFTTHGGEDGWANGQRRGPIAPAAAGSLESRLHRLGKPYVFLDFRALDDTPSHPLRTPQSMRISGYGLPTGPYGNDRVPDLTRAFDAVFFIDRMAPATPISAGRRPGE